MSAGKSIAVGSLLFLLFSTACGQKTTVRDFSSEGGDVRLLELGQVQQEAEHWEDARGFYQQLIDTFPRSQYVGDARIGIADTYFHQRGAGNLVLAIAEYRDVLTFFPNHPRADYVQYQIANSYYRQKQSSDRDQEPTRTAVEELEKLIELYPNSPYAETAKELLRDCNELLAEHEFRVGEFYLKVRKHCHGSIARLKGVAEDYPTFSRVDEVYFQLAEALTLCGQPSEAMPYYQRVVENYPTSDFKDDAEERLDTLLPKGDGVLAIP
ncbi:MAG TPA: outer membrane protein assembly factor BamD [Vicinamibacteria bacterium]|jgi:outer membrane protein assembly factor BamD